MYVACRQVVASNCWRLKLLTRDRTAGSVPKTTLNKPCALPSCMEVYLILAGFMSPAEDVQIFVTGLCIVIKLNATALRSLGRRLKQQRGLARPGSVCGS